MNSYLVIFSYTQYLVKHSMNDPEGKNTTIRPYLLPSILILIVTKYSFFSLVNYSFNTRNIRSKIGQMVTDFLCVFLQFRHLNVASGNAALD
jgi:hypothetical protein